MFTGAALINNDEVLLISSGLINPKKEYNKLSKLNFYLNYGLLGLATELNNNGYSTKVYHGAYEHPDVFADKLPLVNLQAPKYPILLSVPSFYAIPWAQRFIALIKQNNPTSKIIVGGRWVTNGNAKWIRNKLPQVDMVIEGLADGIVNDLLYPSRWPLVVGNGNLSDQFRHCLNQLNYELLDGYEDIPPSIEIGRGCGAGCEFCAEGTMPKTNLKSPDAIFKEIEQYIFLTGNSSPCFYFETSNFHPSTQWIENFEEIYCRKKYSFRWRTEVRADSFSAVDISRLANAGLKVIDIGLESCSSTQLLRMRKTTDPSAYLENAQVLLKKCYEAGVWAKINILLYPGETTDTIDETVGWLLKRRQYIKGVSVWPLTVFGCDNSALKFIENLAIYGAEPVDKNSYAETGITHLHLSQFTDYATSVETSIKLSQMFMTAHDYYDIKSHGYYKLSSKISDYLKIINEIETHFLPFQ